MVLKLYNTLSRKKEVFKSISNAEVALYTCGPTVYNYVHIGNLRAMIVYDLLKRYLKYKGYKVKHVMNITDVDDKTIKNSIKEGKSLKEFTEFYTEAFMDDIITLNIQLPDIMPRATEEIDGMINLIKLLLEKGYAYRSDRGDIYFKISKFKKYGKLANLELKNLKKNAEGRLEDEYEKDDARDFALWKIWDKNDGDVFWDTEIGKGRPGWHIECSVMASKYLRQPFDIHMGGVDLIFPHHTNEIAQSEAAYGKTFCNYWIHNEHLLVNGEKMSKKLGNFFTLRDLTKKGYSQLAIRYELLATHYRQQLDFREKDLEEAKNILQKFKELFIKLDNLSNEKNNPKVKKLIQAVKNDFEKFLDDDLNIASALSALFVFIREVNKTIDDISKSDAESIKKTLLDFDSVLGVMDYKNKEEIPEEIKQLAEKRLKVRNQKDWKRADELRQEIKKKGYQIDDTSERYILKKI